MKKFLERYTGLIIFLVVLSFFINSMLVVTWPYMRGTIASTESYTLLYHDGFNAYSLRYWRDGRVIENPINYGNHHEYYHIDRNRHYVVVEYPCYVSLGLYHDGFASKEKELVWVNDSFRGDVGQEIVFNHRTHEMIEDPVFKTVTYSDKQTHECIVVLLGVVVLLFIIYYIQEGIAKGEKRQDSKGDS